jgi:hypothetical protein
MGLRFNMLLRDAGIELADVRLLRHETQLEPGKTPYSYWRDDPASFERYQSVQHRKNQAKLKGRYWAGFVAPTLGSTMFVGLYEVVGCLGPDPEPGCDRFDCRRVPLADGEGRDYQGRVFVHWGNSPSSKRAWIQRADRQDKPITEVRPRYQEEAFPGPLGFSCRLSELEGLPIGWKQVLTTLTGVYALACTRTGELYVGSAGGSDGFLGRWRAYAMNGHGGNVGLRNRERGDYVVSILDTVGTRGAGDLLAMEGAWKRKLLSVDLGLNRNGPRSAFVVRGPLPLSAAED